MSKQPARRTAPKRRPQARKGRAVIAASSAGKRSDRTSWIIAAVVIAIGVALVIAFAGGSHHVAGEAIKGDQAAPASVVKKVTGIPQSVVDKVGQGSATGLPEKLPGPTLTKDGKPRIVFLGAEYCPYCATERWAMVQALSRFGTFKNLRITTSSSTDVDPNTPTFSFHNTTYTSPYITFESVEQSDNKGDPLEQMSSEQAALVAKYDKAPYTSGGSTSGGTIPFIDIANQYVISGATYDVGVLQGNTWDQIAAAMTDPSTDISKGAVGAANAFTAGICAVTDNKPASACGSSTIKDLVAKLPTKVATG